MCLTCEAQRRIDYVDPARKCHATLWSIEHVFDPQLTVPARRGRHSIFVQREASFQYGGALQRAELEHTPYEWVEGTTVVSGAFSNSNIGHQLHDAHWAFHAALVSREEAQFPR